MTAHDNGARHMKAYIAVVTVVDQRQCQLGGCKRYTSYPFELASDAEAAAQGRIEVHAGLIPPCPLRYEIKEVNARNPIRHSEVS